MLNEIHHGIKFFRPFQEYLNRIGNIVLAVFHSFGNFFFRQLSIYVKGNGTFLNVIPHKPFKGFQAPVRPKHHIIVQKGELLEKAAILPTGISPHNDIIVYFLWIEPAKDRFQNILIVVTAVKSAPYFLYICLI